MEIFWRLVLGHLIGDFTLQSNYIAAWKRRNLWGMLVHCGIHPVIYSVLLWNYMGQVWVMIGPLSLTGWACVAIIFITHFVEDQWRIWSVLKRNAPDNTFFYLWDQIIHYAVLFAMAPAIDGAVGKFNIIRYPEISGVLPQSAAQSLSGIQKFMTVTSPEPWVFVAILFVVVTHFTTVSIFFVEKDLYDKPFPDDKEKYLGMLERFVVASCFLLPGKWWVFLVSGWMAWTLISKLRKTYAYSWTNIAVGWSFTLFCGVLSRHFFYS